MNLKHFDYDKLDSLPTHQSQRQRIYTIFNQSYGWNWDKRYYRRNNLKAKKAQHIVEASVGKNMKEIYAKIRPLLIGRIPFQSIEDWLYSYCHLSDSPHGRYYSFERLYIDKKDNILKERKPPKASPKTTVTNKYRVQAFLQIKERRKRHRQAKRHPNLTLIKLINNPGVYRLYRKLLGQRYECNSKIAERMSSLPEFYNIETVTSWEAKRLNIPISNKGGYMAYWRDIPDPRQLHLKALQTWHLYERLRIAQIKEAKQKLPIIQEQIDRIESGNYIDYFSSASYLYSIQKECHHFEKP